MLKVAFIAAALAVASTAHALDAEPVAPAASVAEPTAIVSAPPTGADWAPLAPPRGTGLDFKDAAADPVSIPAAATGADPRHRALPALLALGALVVLLRKRPT